MGMVVNRLEPVERTIQSLEAKYEIQSTQNTL